MEVEVNMKITASRRDDILKQRDEYDAERNKRKARHDQDMSNYRKAYYDKMEPVADAIKDQLKQFNLLEFDVNVSQSFRDDIEARIQCNEHRVHDESSALSWSYTCLYNKANDEVKRESNSWSGLSACTAEQLASLKQTVAALELLSTLDWKSLLDIALPDYHDFDSTPEGEEPLGDRPDFESQLVEADLEEAMGQPVLVEGDAFEGGQYRPGIPVYYKMLKSTPKQYTVIMVYKGMIDDMIQKGASWDEVMKTVDGYYEYRVSKEKFHRSIDNPVQIVAE